MNDRGNLKLVLVIGFLSANLVGCLFSVGRGVKFKCLASAAIRFQLSYISFLFTIKSMKEISNLRTAWNLEREP